MDVVFRRVSLLNRLIGDISILLGWVMHPASDKDTARAWRRVRSSYRDLEKEMEG